MFANSKAFSTDPVSFICVRCVAEAFIYLLNQISCNVPHNFEQVVVVKVLRGKPEGDILVARGILAIRLKGR